MGSIVLRENRDGSLYWELYNLMQRDSKGLNRLREGVLFVWLGGGVSAAFQHSGFCRLPRRSYRRSLGHVPTGFAPRSRTKDRP